MLTTVFVHQHPVTIDYPMEYHFRYIFELTILPRNIKTNIYFFRRSFCLSTHFYAIRNTSLVRFTKLPYILENTIIVS